MIIGTLESIIFAINEQFHKQLVNTARSYKEADTNLTKIAFSNNETDYLLKEAVESVIEAALAVRLKDNSRIEKIASVYKKYYQINLDPEIYQNMIGWLTKANELSCRRIGMIYLASNNVNHAIHNLRKSLIEAQKLADDTTKHEFLIANAEKISQCLKKTAELYMPITETIKRDISLLSRYDATLADDLIRQEAIEALN